MEQAEQINPKDSSLPKYNELRNAGDDLAAAKNTDVNCHWSISPTWCYAMATLDRLQRISISLDRCEPVPGVFRGERNEACQKLLLKKGPALILLIWLVGLTGCATLGFKTPDPVTVGQVIQMSKDNVPPELIVKKMRDSQSVYPLTAAQLAELHDMGVADQVLNYMQQTYIDAQRREQNADDWNAMSGPTFW